MDFSIPINWTSPFPNLGVSGIFFYFYFISTIIFCTLLQTVDPDQTSGRLIWVCTASFLMSHNRDARLIWVNGLILASLAITCLLLSWFPDLSSLFKTSLIISMNTAYWFNRFLQIDVCNYEKRVVVLSYSLETDAKQSRVPSHLGYSYLVFKRKKDRFLRRGRRWLWVCSKILCNLQCRMCGWDGWENMFCN